MRPINPQPERAASDPWRDAVPAGIAIVAAAMSGLALGAALTGASLSPLTWYLARASGFTLYLLLWLSVVSGLGMTTRLLPSPGGPGGMWALHRITSDLSIILLVLHLVSLALDPSVALGILGVLVPFVSDVRQPWTDLGIVAGYGMIAVSASFSVRHLIGWRAWRWLHVGSLPLWLIALAHGIGAGSDSASLWAGALYVVTTASVLYLVLYRLLRSGTRGWGKSRPAAHLLDREAMRRRVAEYRDRCASSS
jgi:methionine sulfoxide reductase heme-binding subunit